MGSSSILNYFFIIVLFSSLLRADDSLQNAACFEDYSKQTNQILLKYLNAHKACDDKDNIHRKPPSVIDIEGEKQKLRELSNETCSSQSECNLINDASEFYRCHSSAANTNIKKFTIIHLRASSMSIEISDEYEEEEKELLRCRLVAKKSYLNDSFEAYNQHLDCLNNSK